ncbi:hypothetical protein TRIUR3_07779 [Triticum urartu]|uniref:Uncharacterized protein n=1 Tax=Triticum urartu TaxID=4572 RepID=M7YV90_TRIUA|nr:hypothetical protein TRIUR3_07779 [Triticum urartu]
MCGGAILAELIPPSAGRASKQVAAGRASPKKAGKSKGHRYGSVADVDDFEAALENFDDDLDLQAEEDGDDHVVFASKPAFSPGLGTKERVLPMHGYRMIASLMNADSKCIPLFEAARRTSYQLIMSVVPSMTVLEIVKCRISL